jgi:hypothetical protein
MNKELLTHQNGIRVYMVSVSSEGLLAFRDRVVYRMFIFSKFIVSADYRVSARTFTLRPPMANGNKTYFYPKTIVLCAVRDKIKE